MSTKPISGFIDLADAHAFSRGQITSLVVRDHAADSHSDACRVEFTTKESEPMSTTEHKLTDAQIYALEQAERRCKPGTDDMIAEQLRAIRLQFAPSPQLPKRFAVMVTQTEYSSGYDPVVKEIIARPVEPGTTGRGEYIVLRDFPEGLDLVSKLWEEHRIRIYPSISGAWIAEHRSELPDAESFRIDTCETFAAALRAAEQYAEGGK